MSKPDTNPNPSEAPLQPNPQSPPVHSHVVAARPEPLPSIAAAEAASAPPTAEPERDSDHRLTRRGMEAVIRAGGSVMHNGRFVSRVEELPSQADLAKGNPEMERATRASLQQHRDYIDAEIAKLGK